jgi:hypothetical protein
MYSIDFFVGTCVDIEIGKFVEKKGRLVSYKNAVKKIKEFDFNFYNELALNLRNPWADETEIITGVLFNEYGRYLHITHSAIDYIFKLKN